MSEGSRRKKVVNVQQDAHDITEFLDQEEIDLRMDEVKTMVSTIVSFGPPSESQHLLSERLLLASE